MEINSSPTPARSWSLGTTARATVTIMLVLLGFALLLSVRNVLAGIFLGLLLATALRPVMSTLREGKLPRYVAASAAVLLLVGLVVGFLVLVAPLIIAQVDALLEALPGLYAGLRERLTGSRLLLLRQAGYRLEPELPLDGLLGPAGDDELAAMLPAIGYGLFIGACTLLFTYYWLLYRERSIRGLLLLLPMERREAAEGIWLQIEARIGAFLRGQFLLALMTGALSLVGYWLAGVPYAPLLALIGTVLEFVPYLGPIIATGVAVVAGMSVSPGVALAALLIGLGIQQVQNIFFAPRVMDQAVGVSPVVTLLAFVGFTALLGPAGSLLAIPLAATLQVLFSAWVERSGAPAEAAPAGRALADRLRYEVRELASDIAGFLRQKEAAAQADLDSTEEALEQLLDDLDLMLGEDAPTGLPGAGNRPPGVEGPASRERAVGR